MENQDYKSHRRLVPLYHGVVLFAILITLIGSIINICNIPPGSEALYSASLILSISIILIFLFFFIRIFALRAQDRAIRAEENLRHFALTGKLLDNRLNIKQIIALRFAPDMEFVALVQRAANENLKPNDIKKAIVNWKGDFHRV